MIHKTCYICDKIGHKPDMLRLLSQFEGEVNVNYGHEECVIKNKEWKKRNSSRMEYINHTMFR